jgi:2-dehydro-3-deoxy-D-gluconate 5-dehydrogenase
MGIGYGIAYRLAEAGANLVIADLDGQTAEDAAADLVKAGFEATATQTNVAEERDVERMVATSAELYGDIDILVNNAGVYPNILVMNMETDDFARSQWLGWASPTTSARSHSSWPRICRRT